MRLLRSQNKPATTVCRKAPRLKLMTPVTGHKANSQSGALLFQAKASKHPMNISIARVSDPKNTWPDAAAPCMKMSHDRHANDKQMSRKTASGLHFLSRERILVSSSGQTK